MANANDGSIRQEKIGGGGVVLSQWGQALGLTIKAPDNTWHWRNFVSQTDGVQYTPEAARSALIASLKGDGVGPGKPLAGMVANGR